MVVSLERGSTGMDELAPQSQSNMVPARLASAEHVGNMYTISTGCFRVAIDIAGGSLIAENVLWTFAQIAWLFCPGRAVWPDRLPP